jgi:hypothetical protein
MEFQNGERGNPYNPLIPSTYTRYNDNKRGPHRSEGLSKNGADKEQKMFEGTKGKVQEGLSKLEEIGSSLKTVLYIAIAALATAAIALAVAFFRPTTGVVMGNG